jgi:hypothetical protein
MEELSMSDLSTLNPVQLEEFINNGGILDAAKEIKPSVVIDQVPDGGAPSDIVLSGLDIKDPVELLVLLDEDIASGRVKLHPWQIKILMDFGKGGSSDDHPLQQVVRACNGSGKDKYVIAPCVVWLCMAFVKARGVVTSSSGQQLDSQTGTYITQLCQAANRKFQDLFGQPIWKINYRYYECLATGSPIDLFATDEPKKAEGYHPLVPDAKMGIFVSEDKSVPDDINIALNRCTGYTHRLHVSTPGEPMGHFKAYCDISVPREAIEHVSKLEPTDWVQYHITAFDCSHLSRSYIEQMKRDLPGGEGGVAYRSIVMAEFGSAEAMVVIPSIYVWKAVNGCKYGHKTKTYNDAGLDLSDGGDETVLAIRNGNRLMHLIPFRFDNTQDTIRFLDEKFRSFQLNNSHSRINADCGGMGKPMLDQLKGMGWLNIHYIDNRNTPHEPRVYKNRAAELWFRFRKLLEQNEIWLLDDHKLKTQLATRFYSITPENKHQLESKPQARAKGHPSPDRADAVVLAFWEFEQLTPSFVPETKPFERPEVPDDSSTFTLNEYARREESGRLTLQPSKKFNFSPIRDLIVEHNKLIRSIESS